MSKEVVERSKVAKFESAYGHELDAVGSAMNKNYGIEMTSQDILAFGQMCESWQEFRPYFESDVTTRDALGELLSSNIGLITASYAGLPIQPMASVQHLPDEVGLVYKRSAVATNTRGGITIGDSIIGEHGATPTDIDTYTSDFVTKTGSAVAAATVLANATAAGSVVGVAGGVVTLGPNVIPGTVKITAVESLDASPTVAVSTFTAIDIATDTSTGYIVGVGFDSSGGTANQITYASGAVTIVLGAAVTAASTTRFTITYRQSLVTNAADQIPGFRYELLTHQIRANYYMIKAGFSSVSDMVVKKKFGSDLSNEVIADAARLINSSIMYNATNLLNNAADTNGTTPITSVLSGSSGVSKTDARALFNDALVEATSQMYAVSGKGDVNFIIVAAGGMKVLQTLGFTPARRGLSGIHLSGNWDGIPVYYAPGTAILAANEVLVGYRGQSWYESPLVYAPYLPATYLTGSGGSVFVKEAGVYSSAGLDIVNPGFVCKINLTLA